MSPKPAALAFIFWTSTATGVAAAPPYGPGWSAPHADGANTNYLPVPGASHFTLAWHRKFAGTINLGATSDGHGRVYVTTTAPGCHLYVLDRLTGETIWCSDKLDKYAVSSSALLDDRGRAFIADSQGMHAFGPDGSELWSTPINGVPLSAQFTPKGNLLFITNIGQINILDRDSGAHRMPPLELIPGARFDPSKGARACMRGTRDCPSANTVAIDERRSVIFFTFWEPRKPNAGVRAMQLKEDGTRTSLALLWSNDTLPGGSASSPILSADRSRVYVNDNADSLHALDAATGREIWSFKIGYEAEGCSSVSPDGIIMPAGGRKGELMALRDVGDKAALLWRHDGELNRGIPTQVGGNIAYPIVSAGSLKNDLLVVDATTGKELDREKLPGNTVFTIGTTIGKGGYVYVPTFLGDVFAFKPE